MKNVLLSFMASFVVTFVILQTIRRIPWASIGAITYDAFNVRKQSINPLYKTPYYSTGLSDGFAKPQTSISLHGDTPQLVPIPIDPKRWYTLNNLSIGLDALFDNMTDMNVNTGSSSFIPNYDSYYPVDNGERIVLKQIKFYDLNGTFTKDPVTISVIKSNGQRLKVATFTGGNYQGWVGPYPERSAKSGNRFQLDSPITDIQYIVLNCTNSNLPSLQLDGPGLR
jgi:hypothetical protein